jgi:hypothetical protein
MGRSAKKLEVTKLVASNPKEKVEGMSVINSSVSKTVKDSAGKDFKRKANISIAISEGLVSGTISKNEKGETVDGREVDLEKLIATFGSLAKLLDAALYGVISKAKSDANLELTKGDKASKALKKIANSLMSVIPGITFEAAVKQVLGSNPEWQSAFKSEDTPAEISWPVNPATQSMKVVDLESGEVEEDEEEEEDEK